MVNILLYYSEDMGSNPIVAANFYQMKQQSLIADAVAKEVFNTEGIFSTIWYSDYTFSEVLPPSNTRNFLYSALFTLENDTAEVAAIKKILIKNCKQLLN